MNSIFVKCVSAIAFSAIISGSCLPPAGAETASGGAASAASLNEIEKYLNHSSRSAVDGKIMQGLQEILQQEPNNARAHFLTGRAYEHLGMTDLATQEYAAADKIAPTGADAVLRTFSKNVMSGDLRASLQDYNYINERFSEEPVLMLLQAQVCMGKGLAHEVDFYLERALEVKPRELGMATAAGELRLKQHRPLEALALAREDLAAKPDYWRASGVAGLACLQLHRYDQGARYIRKAFTLHPTDKELDKSYATAFRDAQMYGEALAPAMVYMSMCINQEQLESAKVELLALVRRLPRQDSVNVAEMVDGALDKTAWQGRFHLALGDVFDHAGWFSQAEKQYTAGIALDPSVARAYYRLAVDAAINRKYAAALWNFKQAYERDAHNIEVQRGYLRLGERLDNRKNDIAWRLKDWLKNR